MQFACTEAVRCGRQSERKVYKAASMQRLHERQAVTAGQHAGNAHIRTASGNPDNSAALDRGKRAEVETRCMVAMLDLG